jgi:hypothetical protein
MTRTERRAARREQTRRLRSDMRAAFKARYFEDAAAIDGELKATVASLDTLDLVAQSEAQQPPAKLTLRYRSTFRHIPHRAVV